jgi:FlaG/FlaF family flagellin (archaellin)
MAQGEGVGQRVGRENRRCQSDAIGVILLVAITLIAGGGAVLWTTGIVDVGLLEGATTKASVEVTYDDGTITMTHRAGDTVPIDETTVDLESGRRSTNVPLSAFSETSGDGDGTWESGETLEYGYVPDGRRMDLRLIHGGANTVFADLSLWVDHALRASLSTSRTSGTAPVSVSFTASASGGSGGPARLDFSGRSTTSYGGTQDTDANDSVIEDGYGIGAYGDSWRVVPFEYAVTEDTVLRFQFRSDDAGEIHGIGLEEDTWHSADRIFRLHGSQNDWGIGAFDGEYATGSGWQTYEIPVGEYYTGQMDYLAFVMDGDADGGTTEFRDVQVYETDGDPGYTYSWSIDSLGSATGTEVDHTFVSGGEYAASVTVTDPAGNSLTRNTTIDVEPMARPIDFSTRPIESFGDQDKAGAYSVTDGGATLHVSGNAWKRVALNTTCAITSNTVLALEFNSTREGEIHAVGFDDDRHESADRLFKLYGTQPWGIREFDTYRSGDGWRGYVLPIGEYYTGSFEYLVIVTDDDADADAVTGVRNVAIYQRSDGNFTRACSS